MNTQNDLNNDPLRRYLNPGTIEKAPQGFSEKMMQMVSLEPKRAAKAGRHFKVSPVPLISITITVILAVATIAFPSSNYDLSWLPVTDAIKSLVMQAGRINFDAISGIKLPGFLPYLFLSILFLTLFDRGLSNLFHRHKKSAGDE
jgi:hypothetical protein